MDEAQEIVITGVGVVSPIGIGKEAFARSLDERRSGVTEFTKLGGTIPEFRLAASVADFDAKQFVKPRKAIKVMSVEIQMAYAAAELAMQDAALERGQAVPERFGVVMGADLFHGPPEELQTAQRCCHVDGEFDFDLWGDCAMKNVYPLWMLKYLPNMAGCQVGIAHDARGPNNSIALGEVSGLLSLCEAATLIERGWADVMLAGGTGTRLSPTPLAFRGNIKSSTFDGDPANAVRPFDAGRKGIVNGEGAGVVVLESRQHAEQRGARVLARLAGWGRTCGAAEDPVQRTAAIERSIDQALQTGRIAASDVGHVNAHGMGTIEDDPIEAGAISNCLGNVPVTAPKSYFGYLGAGGGVVELTASLLALETGEVPVTLNYEQPDPACPVNVVRDTPARAASRNALILSQSDRGQAVAVALAAS